MIPEASVATADYEPFCLDLTTPVNCSSVSKSSFFSDFGKRRLAKDGEIIAAAPAVPFVSFSWLLCTNVLQRPQPARPGAGSGAKLLGVQATPVIWGPSGCTG
jgi:hypothetical protein